MSTFLVIPAGASPDDVAYPDRVDKPTWRELARQAGAEGCQQLGSAWCVEHAIDGLGVCTEESGQESAAQRLQREQREAEQAERALAALSQQTAGKLLERLRQKGIISTAEADEITRPTTTTRGDARLQ